MLSLVAHGLLRLGGWTAVGEPPDLPKVVYIAAPHTSNWDGFWGVVYKIAKKVDAHFFVKDSLFRFPYRWILKNVGAVALDRSRPGAAVPQAVKAFRDNETYAFGLAPEGTRSLRPLWKSGFYRIALEAGVPVVLGFFDYGKKRIGIGPIIELTGDVDADMARIRAFYETVQGCHPENASPVRLAEESGNPRRKG